MLSLSSGALVRPRDHRLLRRTLARLDVSSRRLFALIDAGSCFAGTLAELAFAADRAYMAGQLPTPTKAPHR